jgi:hypothetical protein
MTENGVVTVWPIAVRVGPGALGRLLLTRRTAGAATSVTRGGGGAPSGTAATFGRSRTLASSATTAAVATTAGSVRRRATPAVTT